MSTRKKILSLFIATIFSLSLASCGGDDGNGANGGGNIDEEAAVASIVLGLTSMSMLSTGFFGPMFLTGDQKADTQSCPDGGTITISGDSVEYNDCDYGTVLINGKISFSDTSSGEKITFDNLTYEFDDFTSIIDGSITLDYDEETITWNNFSISDGTNTITYSGTISYVEGTDSATATFDDYSVTASGPDGSGGFTINGSITYYEDGRVEFDNLEITNSIDVTCDGIVTPPITCADVAAVCSGISSSDCP